MRAVFGLVLVIGMGLAGFAVYMVKGYFEQQQVALARERAASAQQVPTVEVIAVNRAMTYGEQITKDDVQFIRYAEPFLPEGVFYTGEELFPEGGDALRTVLRPMEPNEPILAVKVTDPGQGAGITSRLGAGMRAFAIRVDVSSGVSGFLRPGDNVDVYWSGRVPAANGDGVIPVTRLIETGIKIVAVDQSADDTLNRAMVARTVTVEVTPQQVAALAQAQNTGDLSLSLVGLTDDTVAEAIQVDQVSLLGLQVDNGPAPVAPQEEVCTIRQRKGAELVITEIPCID